MAIHVNQATASISATTTTARTAYPQNQLQGGVRVVNTGTVPVFLQSGDVTVVATTAGGVVGAGATEVFYRNANDTHLAAITASGTATVYFQPCGGSDN